MLPCLLSVWLGGCATGSSCTKTGPQAAQSGQHACPQVYWFESLVLSASGQLESGGGAVVEMPACGVAETKPSELEQSFHVRVDAARPGEAIVDAEIAGEKLHARLPIIPKLRVVVEERWREDKGKVLVTVTAFESQQQMREAMRVRLARSGIDITTARPFAQPVSEQE